MTLRRCWPLALVWLAACAVPAPGGLPEGWPEQPPYSLAVAARFPDPPQRHHTPGLAPGRHDLTTHDELLQWQRGLAAGGGSRGTAVRTVALGESAQGLPIEALHFSRAAGRPVALLVAQQHGDEPAGAEALLVLARELAQGPLAEVLDRLDVVLLPRANPDGAAWGTRVGTHGLDINRDHLLLRSPEARAQAALVRRFRPVLVADLHEHTVVGRYLEKFGAVQRNDLLLQHATTANLPPALDAAAQAWFLQPLRQDLAAEGLSHEWYYTNPTPPDDRRLNMGGVQPDTGRNVQGLKHAVSLLLETRGVGIGRLHLQRRVHTHLVAARSLLRQAAKRADDLVALQRRLDDEVAALACRGRMTVLAAGTPQRREILMLDPVTGADRSVTVDWTSALELQPQIERERPCGYWLSARATEAVGALTALGVRMQPAPAGSRWQVQGWQELSRNEVDRPDVRGTVADGFQQIVRLRVALAPPRPWTAGEAGWYLPLNQPLAHLVVAALEPDTQNSYLANRLLPGLADALRVVAPP